MLQTDRLPDCRLDDWHTSADHPKSWLKVSPDCKLCQPIGEVALRKIGCSGDPEDGNDADAG